LNLQSKSEILSSTPNQTNKLTNLLPCCFQTQNNGQGRQEEASNRGNPALIEEWVMAKSSNQNHAKFRSKAIQQLHSCINVSGVNGSRGDVSAIKFPNVLSAAINTLFL
jgi:hypothetical protein